MLEACKSGAAVVGPLAEWCGKAGWSLGQVGLGGKSVAESWALVFAKAFVTPCPLFVTPCPLFVCACERESENVCVREIFL